MPLVKFIITYYLIHEALTEILEQKIHRYFCYKSMIFKIYFIEYPYIFIIIEDDVVLTALTIHF